MPNDGDTRIRSLQISGNCSLVDNAIHYQVHQPESLAELLPTYQVMWRILSSFLWMTPSQSMDTWSPGSTTWGTLVELHAVARSWQCGDGSERATRWLEKLSLHQPMWPIRGHGFSTFTMKWSEWRKGITSEPTTLPAIMLYQPLMWQEAGGDSVKRLLEAIDKYQPVLLIVPRGI